MQNYQIRQGKVGGIEIISLANEPEEPAWPNVMISVIRTPKQLAKFLKGLVESASSDAEKSRIEELSILTPRLSRRNPRQMVLFIRIGSNAVQATDVQLGPDGLLQLSLVAAPNPNENCSCYVFINHHKYPLQVIVGPQNPGPPPSVNPGTFSLH